MDLQDQENIPEEFKNQRLKAKQQEKLVMKEKKI